MKKPNLDMKIMHKLGLVLIKVEYFIQELTPKDL